MAASATLAVMLSLLGGVRTTELYERGRDPATGLLLNCSAMAVPFDARRPTLVFVHGANPFARRLHFTMAQRLGQSVARRYGASFNVLGWDWNSDTIVSMRISQNLRHAVGQGRALADALLRCGADPSTIHLIGQSAGCVVATGAAQALAGRTGRRVAQLTLLDPAFFEHPLIFRQLGAGTLAHRVENYYVGGPSGYGRPAASPGVWDCRLDFTPRAGVLGWIRPLQSDHMNAVAWYIDSVEQPLVGSGFGTCVFLAH